MRNLHEVGKPKQLSREDIEKYINKIPTNPFYAASTFGTVNGTWTLNYTTLTNTTTTRPPR